MWTLRIFKRNWECHVAEENAARRLLATRRVCLISRQNPNFDILYYKRKGGSGRCHFWRLWHLKTLNSSLMEFWAWFLHFGLVWWPLEDCEQLEDIEDLPRSLDLVFVLCKSSNLLLLMNLGPSLWLWRLLSHFEFIPWVWDIKVETLCLPWLHHHLLDFLHD